jgi:hypothetical protein
MLRSNFGAFSSAHVLMVANSSQILFYCYVLSQSINARVSLLKITGDTNFPIIITAAIEAGVYFQIPPSVKIMVINCLMQVALCYGVFLSPINILVV